MVTAEFLRTRNDIDIRWPAGELLQGVGFETKVRTCVLNLLKTRGTETLSLRELMDLIVPATGGGPTSKEACWGFPPILDQRHFGWLLYISALLTLTGGDFGVAFRYELGLRVYHRMIMSHLWLMRRPAPQRTRRKNGPADPQAEMMLVSNALILPPYPYSSS